MGAIHAERGIYVKAGTTHCLIDRFGTLDYVAIHYYPWKMHGTEMFAKIVSSRDAVTPSLHGCIHGVSS